MTSIERLGHLHIIMPQLLHWGLSTAICLRSWPWRRLHGAVSNVVPVLDSYICLLFSIAHSTAAVTARTSGGLTGTR